MFEADFFKQTGRCEKTNLLSVFFFFTRRVTKVQESNADRNCLVGMPGYRRSDRHLKDVPEGIETDDEILY